MKKIPWHVLDAIAELCLMFILGVWFITFSFADQIIIVGLACLLRFAWQVWQAWRDPFA